MLQFPLARFQCLTMLVAASLTTELYAQVPVTGLSATITPRVTDRAAYQAALDSRISAAGTPETYLILGMGARMLREGYSHDVTLAWMNHVKNQFQDLKLRARATTPDNSNALAALNSVAGSGRQLLSNNSKVAPWLYLGEEIGKLVLTPSLGWNLMEQGDAQRKIQQINQESIYISKYAADVLGVEVAVTNPGTTVLFDQYLQGSGLVDFSLRDGLATVLRKNPLLKVIQVVDELDRRLEKSENTQIARNKEINLTLQQIQSSSQESLEMAKREEAEKFAEARRIADYSKTVWKFNEAQAASAILIRFVGLSNPEEARRLQTITDVAFTTMRLQHDFNFQKIGAFALANGYLGGALAITSLLSKSGPSTDEIIMSQLAAMAKQISDLRQEMGSFEGRVQMRFSELHSTLRQMHTLLDIDLKRLLLATENLEQEATRISNHLRTLSRQLASVQGAILRAIKTTAEFPFYERREACLWARAVDGPDISYEAYSSCASTFTTWATTTSVAMAQIQAAEEVDVANLQALVNYAATLGNADAKRFEGVVPDPNVWAQSTQAYLALVADWPQYALGYNASCASDKACQKRNSAIDVGRLSQTGQSIWDAQTGIFLLADGSYYSKTKLLGGFVEYKNPTAEGLRQLLTSAQFRFLQVVSDTAWDYIDRSMFGLDPWYLGEVAGRVRITRPLALVPRKDISRVRPSQLTQAIQAVKVPTAMQCKETSVPKHLSAVGSQLSFALPENIRDVLPPFVIYTMMTTQKPFEVKACFDVVSASYRAKSGKRYQIEKFDKLENVEATVQISLRVSAGFLSDADRETVEEDWRSLGKSEIYRLVSTVQAWDVPVDFRQQSPMKAVADHLKADFEGQVDSGSVGSGNSAVNFSRERLLPQMRKQVIGHLRSELNNGGSRLASAYQDFVSKVTQGNALVLAGLFPGDGRLDSTSVESLATSISGMTGSGVETMLETAIELEKRTGAGRPSLIQQGELSPHLPAGIGSLPAESLTKSLDTYLAIVDKRIEDLERSTSTRTLRPTRIVSSEVGTLLTRLNLLSVGLEMFALPPAFAEPKTLPSNP